MAAPIRAPLIIGGVERPASDGGTFDVHAPEPGTLVLLGGGLVMIGALAVRRRRRRGRS